MENSTGHHRKCMEMYKQSLAPQEGTYKYLVANLRLPILFPISNRNVTPAKDTLSLNYTRFQKYLQNSRIELIVNNDITNRSNVTLNEAILLDFRHYISKNKLFKAVWHSFIMNRNDVNKF